MSYTTFRSAARCLEGLGAGWTHVHVVKAPCGRVAKRVVTVDPGSPTLAPSTPKHAPATATHAAARMHKGEVGKLGIDVVMCDEAHQLKNADAQITQAVSQLATKRRLLISGELGAPARWAPRTQCPSCARARTLPCHNLTPRMPSCMPCAGTPIQNDLSEFHAVYDVACPGLLGNANEFRRKVRSGRAGTTRLAAAMHARGLALYAAFPGALRPPAAVATAPGRHQARTCWADRPLPAQYELPIQRGRDADASEAQVERGLAAMNELMELCNKFLLRRTSTVLKKLLPAKVEQVRARRCVPAVTRRLERLIKRTSRPCTVACAPRPRLCQLVAALCRVAHVALAVQLRPPTLPGGVLPLEPAAAAPVRVLLGQ